MTLLPRSRSPTHTTRRASPPRGRPKKRSSHTRAESGAPSESLSKRLRDDNESLRSFFRNAHEEKTFKVKEDEAKRQAREKMWAKALQQLRQVEQNAAIRRADQEREQKPDEMVVVTFKVYSFIIANDSRTTAVPLLRRIRDTIDDSSGFVHQAISHSNVTVRRRDLEGIQLGQAYWDQSTPGITALDVPAVDLEHPFFQNQNVQDFLRPFRSNISA
jgi:hypothetical protein